jgi:Rho-type GTPase-activating protein 1/2
MITEKSLPALPPNVIPNNAFSNDRVDPESDTPTELSPRPQPTQRHTGSSSHSNKRATRSPERQAKPLEGLGLSSHPFRPNRNSTIAANDSSGDDGFFIPVALDPSPGPSSTPRSGSDIQLKKDSFSNSRPSLAEKRTESQSSTPHIAFQDKGRQPSEPEVGSLSRKLSKSSKQDQRQSTNSLEDNAPTLPARAMPPPDEFKLQDAPKNKRLVTTGSTSSQSSAQQDPAPKQPTSATSSRYEKEGLPSSETWAVNDNAPVRSSQDSDRRGSVESGRRPSGSKIARKEVGVTGKSGKQTQKIRVTLFVLIDTSQPSQEAQPQTTRRRSRAPRLGRDLQIISTLVITSCSHAWLLRLR